VKNGEALYGVTSAFGSRAHVTIPPKQASELQQNLLSYHKTGAGENVPAEDVRAAMLLRANSHMLGVSGVRSVIVQRIVDALNRGITPVVPEFGSIGASGDLVPLTYIAGAIFGHQRGFKVLYKGKVIDALDALNAEDLAPILLGPKEGLAMINGTSFMTGVASVATREALVRRTR
jgi:phenylalanine ammonia-lyase